MFDFGDRGIAVDLLVQVLGNVLHQCAQRAVQHQVAVTCEGTQLMQRTHTIERHQPKIAIAGIAVRNCFKLEAWEAEAAEKEVDGGKGEKGSSLVWHSLCFVFSGLMRIGFRV